MFLLFSYYYLAIQPHSGAWPPGGLPSLKLSLPNTFILLASSVAVWWGEWGTKRGNRLVADRRARASRSRSASSSSSIQYFEWQNKPFRLEHGCLRLALLHHNRLPHGSRDRRALGAHRPCSFGPCSATSDPCATHTCRSARSTGTSSMPCGSLCSSPSTSPHTSDDAMIGTSAKMEVGRPVPGPGSVLVRSYSEFSRRRSPGGWHCSAFMRSLAIIAFPAARREPQRCGMLNGFSPRLALPRS